MAPADSKNMNSPFIDNNWDNEVVFVVLSILLKKVPNLFDKEQIQQKLR